MESKELNFYKVDKKYIDYLRAEEIKEHGKSYIPLLDYKPPQKEKFMCGIILTIGHMEYLAPVTSYKIKQSNNVLLYDSNGNVTSSIRLNYMFPVSKEYYTIYDFNAEVDKKYRGVVQAERNSANLQRETIRKLGLKTYQTVKRLNDAGLNVNWACDFQLLESALKRYRAK